MKNYISRHIDIEQKEFKLKFLNLKNEQELIDKVFPKQILSTDFNPNLPKSLNEFEFTNHIKELANKNIEFKSYLGQGYYPSFLPKVIQRCVLENPNWYTAYTPYQAEISQGRLEALLNFQTLICELTGFDVANASLLDEANASAEAMLMLFRNNNNPNKKSFFVSSKCFIQTIEVIKTRAYLLDIDLVIDDENTYNFDDTFFGALFQNPDDNGLIYDLTTLISKLKNFDIKTIIISDILSLMLLKSPKDMGAEVSIGSTQRFGLPMGFGGPHSAFFATKSDYKRIIPGRIIGVSIDRMGQRALRMSLQTREQHIRREKATSNICTSQVLLAILTSFYAIYNGKNGLIEIATSIHKKAVTISESLKKFGYFQENISFFDTLKFKVNLTQLNEIKQNAEKLKINFRYFKDAISISINETTTLQDLNEIISIFNTKKTNLEINLNVKNNIPENLMRDSNFLNHPIFNNYNDEHSIMRYIKQLERKDYSLTDGMIPLGSCTMKLNSANMMEPISWSKFANIHPFAPTNQVLGYLEITNSLGEYLKEITGFDGVSFQPNSGAQGELAGLITIRRFHESKGNFERKKILIPASAHGTNPASAVLAGFEVVVVNCDKDGNIDLENLKEKIKNNEKSIAGLMITYPSTHGIFEENILDITSEIKKIGGKIYMDGANLNAMVGITCPKIIGADVCHINLHKTFSIPHGGGGPGMGPICVEKELVPFLPNHFTQHNSSQPNYSVSPSHFGSALILLISYSYIRLLGKDGVKQATINAILNANYMKEKISKNFNVLFKNKKGFVAHEFIIDCRNFKSSTNIEVEDITKRILDYGFHAPTVSFPIAGTLMIEPTESEPIYELDRFCEALKNIHNEIKEIQDGIADKMDNVLLNAPHPILEIVSGEWTHPYSREKAIYPINTLKQNKFFPSISRVDNAHGDRNFICTCPSVEEYK